MELIEDEIVYPKEDCILINWGDENDDYLNECY